VRPHRLVMCVATVALIGSCARSPEPGKDATPDTTASQTPDTTDRATLLVQALPAGVEGLELTDKGLRVMKGYEFVKDTDTTFSITRMSDGRRGVATGGCGCRLINLGCYAELRDGIIVCTTLLCKPCGLMVRDGSHNTEVLLYDRP